MAPKQGPGSLAMVNVDGAKKATAKTRGYVTSILNHLFKIIIFRNSTGSEEFWIKEIVQDARRISEIKDNKRKGGKFETSVYMAGVDLSYSFLKNRMDYAMSSVGAKPLVQKSTLVKNLYEVQEAFREFFSRVVSNALHGGSYNVGVDVVYLATRLKDLQ